jgi:hypothetical protein
MAIARRTKEEAMNVDSSTSDKSVDYRASSAYVWTEKAFEKLQKGVDLHGEVVASEDGVMASRVWGQCPRCNHHIDDRQTLTAFTSTMGVRVSGVTKDVPAETTEVRYVQVDVSCDCGDPHVGAPDGKIGCGTSFRVELPVSPPEPTSHS